MKPHLFFFCIYLCFLSWVGWLPTAATPGANSEPFALPPAGMVFIPGGTFLMGGDAGLMDGGSQSHRSAYPIHEVQVDPFWMDQTEVTNRQFSEFVDATGYVTFAERPLPQEEVEALKRMAVAKAIAHPTDDLPKISGQVRNMTVRNEWLELATRDGARIESVLIPEGDRRTLCVSSQVGCSLDCSFCATAKLGFGRNLGPDEIVDQVVIDAVILPGEHLELPV